MISTITFDNMTIQFKKYMLNDFKRALISRNINTKLETYDFDKTIITHRNFLENKIGDDDFHEIELVDNHKEIVRKAIYNKSILVEEYIRGFSLTVMLRIQNMESEVILQTKNSKIDLHKIYNMYGMLWDNRYYIEPFVFNVISDNKDDILQVGYTGQIITTCA